MPQDSVAFDRAADYYDDTRGFPPGEETPAVRGFVAAGALTKRSRLLEIGIGTGRIALPLAPFVSSITGVDISRPMMTRLRQKQNGEAIHVAEADALRLPFADGTFDAVVAVHVFHLIPRWREVLTEVARVLRPNAPLLHSGNERQSPPTLDAQWQRISQQLPHTSRAVPFEERHTFLQNEGWREQSGSVVHTFVTQRSPMQYVEQLRQRRWSHCWVMTDEELGRSIAELEEHIAATIADPHAPIAVESSFSVQAYLPPAV